MKRLHFAALIAALYLLPAGTANAHHATPIPHGGDGPFFYLPNDLVGTDGFFDSNGTDYIIGWKYAFPPGGDCRGGVCTPEELAHAWIPTSPTVILVDCKFDFRQPFWVYNGSTLHLIGSGLGNFSTRGLELSAFDESKINITGGRVESVFGSGASTISVTDAVIDFLFSYAGSGTATLHNVTDAVVFGESGIINIDGDSNVSGLTATFGKISMTGGKVRSTVRSIGIPSQGEPGGEIGLDGGVEVGGLRASGGTISMTGGKVVGSIESSEVGSASLSGVTVMGGVSVSSSGAVRFFSNSTIAGRIDASGFGKIRMDESSIVGVVEGREQSDISVTDSQLNGGLETYDDANATVFGISNSLSGNVFAHGSSTIELNGGGTVLGNVLINGDSIVSRATVKLDGILVTGGVTASTNSKFEMTSGSINDIFAFDNGVADLSGGRVFAGVNAFTESHITLGGAVIVHNNGVTAFDSASVTMQGGIVHGNLQGFSNSITSMSGGHVTGFPVFYQNATFLYFGGTFGLDEPGGGGSLQAFAEGAGGDDDPVDPAPLHGFTALDNSQIHFIGFGLQSMLVDPNFEGMFSVYQLSGRMADGTTIDGGLVYTQNGTGAGFQLLEAPVPEPCSMTLLVVATFSCGLFQRRKWHVHGPPASPLHSS